MLFAVFSGVRVFIVVYNGHGIITHGQGLAFLHSYNSVIITGSIFHIEDSRCGILYKGLQLNGGLDWLLYIYSPLNSLAPDFTVEIGQYSIRSHKIRLKLASS